MKHNVRDDSPEVGTVHRMATAAKSDACYTRRQNDSEVPQRYHSDSTKVRHTLAEV